MSYLIADSTARNFVEVADRVYAKAQASPFWHLAKGNFEFRALEAAYFELRKAIVGNEKQNANPTVRNPG